MHTGMTSRALRFAGRAPVIAGGVIIISMLAAGPAPASTQASLLPGRPIGFTQNVTHAAARRAAATSTCYAKPNAVNCDDTDPVKTGCNTGSYVASSNPVYLVDPENGQKTGGSSGYIQNWYSPHCGTNWARYVDTSGTGGQVAIITCLNNEFVHCTDWYYSDDFPAWSNQLYAKTTVATAFASWSGVSAQGSASA
jgi:hypothetical protein